MKRNLISAILLLACVTTTCLGDLTEDYSDDLSDLIATQVRWQELEVNSDLSQSTKDSVGAQIDYLVQLLKLGGEAGKLEVSDESIMNGAAQLLGTAFGMSANSLLTSSKAIDVEHELSSVVRRLFDKAETAHLLAQPIYISESLLSAPLSWIWETGKCTLRLIATRSNPESAVRFAEFDIRVLAAPAGGTFTWAWVRRINTDGYYGSDEIENVIVFGTSPTVPPPAKILRNASLDGEVLPIQETTAEGSAGELDFSQQIVKGAGLSSPLSPLSKGFRDLLIAVRYDAPNGSSCSAMKLIHLNDSPPFIFSSDGFIPKEVLDRLREQEGWTPE